MSSQESVTRTVSKPWLWLPTRLAHDLSPVALKCYGAFCSSRSIPEWRPLDWKGLHFPNRLGLAGGVDKNAASVRDWWTLGPGFLEIGTVTPESQGPNPGRIMARDLSQSALWNRMGFPSRGAALVASRLQRLPRPYRTPLFINIGKNRATANERAQEDYIRCIQTLSGLADVFVINISSPNTKGLRELQSETYLETFLGEILAARSATSSPHTPVLIKLSPDMEEGDLNMALDVSLRAGIDGWVLTNTTQAREHGSPFPTEGGVSGRPLSERSKKTLTQALHALGPNRNGKLVVSVGGIMTPEDVEERLNLGADLVQVYSALIFEGPGFFRQVSKHFAAR